MKRFAIKFSVVILLFFIPVAVYRFHVIPNLSGDLGKLGMIPYGKEYEGLDAPGYNRGDLSDADVYTVSSADSLALYPVLTVGDSFSQQGASGYQWKLSSLLDCPIANYNDSEYNVFNRYLALLNGDNINPGQVVIVECVERCLIGRLCELDFNAQSDKSPLKHDDAGHDDPFLNRFFSWIRLSLNIDNPINIFKLSKQCFTHPRFGDILHIYNSPKDWDGDLLWEQYSEQQFSKAFENLHCLIDHSNQMGINLVVLIATDRYDAYEPWIEGGHKYNPTLDKMPSDPHVFNTKPLLQEMIRNDVLDVYKINNTHWSLVGADAVADSLYSWMQSR